MIQIRRTKIGRASAILLAAALLAMGCGQTVTASNRKAIYQDVPNLSTLPEKVTSKKWPENTIVSLEKGTPAPFSGILFIEQRALEAGKVRIEYDGLYAIAEINRRLMVTIIKIADKQLADADNQIELLHNKTNSWWVRNAFAIGVVGGFVIGVGLTGLVVWGISKAVK